MANKYSLLCSSWLLLCLVRNHCYNASSSTTLIFSIVVPVLAWRYTCVCWLDKCCHSIILYVLYEWAGLVILVSSWCFWCWFMWSKWLNITHDTITICHTYLWYSSHLNTRTHTHNTHTHTHTYTCMHTHTHTHTHMHRKWRESTPSTNITCNT